MKAEILLCKHFLLLSSCHWNCVYKKEVNVQLCRSISHVGGLWHVMKCKSLLVMRTALKV